MTNHLLVTANKLISVSNKVELNFHCRAKLFQQQYHLNVHIPWFPLMLTESYCWYKFLKVYCCVGCSWQVFYLNYSSIIHINFIVVVMCTCDDYTAIMLVFYSGE